MRRFDFVFTLMVVALIAGGAWLLMRKRQANDASYYEPRPEYFDTDPSRMPDDWPGWDARVDVFVRFKTNRPACDAVESGYLAWNGRVPVVVVKTEKGNSIKIRTDRIKKVEDLDRFPAIELPYDRGVDIKVSTRLQRSQYLVNWVHKHGFRFVANVPNGWRDYYQGLREQPGGTVVLPAPGFTMKDCRTTPEKIECEHGGNNKRCQDDRYSEQGSFLYPDWASDFPRDAALKTATTHRPSIKNAPPEPSPTPEVDLEPSPWKSM